MKWNEKSKQYQIRRSTERTTRNARTRRTYSSLTTEHVLRRQCTSILRKLFLTNGYYCFWHLQRAHERIENGSGAELYTQWQRGLTKATNTKSLHSRLQCSLWADHWRHGEASDQKKNIDVRMRKTGKTTSTVLSLSIQSQEPQCAEAITNETCSQTTLVHLQNSNKKAPNKTYPWFLLNLNPTEIEQYQPNQATTNQYEANGNGNDDDSGDKSTEHNDTVATNYGGVVPIIAQLFAELLQHTKAQGQTCHKHCFHGKGDLPD